MQWLTAFFADPRQSPVAAEAPALQDGTTPSAEQVVPQIEAPCFPALHRAAQTELCTRCSVRIASLCSVLKKVAVAPHGVWMRGSKAFRALRRMQDQQSFAILQCLANSLNRSASAGIYHILTSREKAYIHPTIRCRSSLFQMKHTCLQQGAA